MGGRDDEAEEDTRVSDAPGLDATLDASDAPPERETARQLPQLSGLVAGATIGRYRLVDKLGAGAMGVVWSAIDPQLDRRIAIKLVHPTLLRTPEAAQRLMREARAMAKVSSRAVVTIHDAGDVEGQLFIAMELVEGTDLGSMLRQRTAAQLADWQRWLAMLLDAGRGLVAAHKAGVLHRDFKPDNVLVARDGRVCVGDFGLATLGEETLTALTSRSERSADVELTSTGALIGTPVYMSLQQLRSQPVDARADQFSYCVATWEALYGARPFPTPTPGLAAISELADAIERGVLPEPPADTRVPSLVRDILARGLAADPDKRWPDMAALVTALERAVPRAPQSKFRERGVWALEVSALTAVVIASVLVVVLGRSCSRKRAPLTAPVITAPAPPRSAKKLWSVPLRTGLALSTDQRYLAMNSDRLQVRDITTGEEWSTLIPTAQFGEVTHMELDGTTLRFGARHLNAIMRWDFRSQEPPVRERELPGMWFGTLATGELSYVYPTTKLQLVDASNAVTRTWDIAPKLEDVTITPDRRRFAYIHPARFRGRIVIGSVDSATTLSSAELDGPTAATFVSNDELLYASGTLVQPQITRARITGDALVDAGSVYSLDTGWFGPLRQGGSTLYVVQMQPAPRTSLVLRSKTTTTSRDLDNASVSLGWVSPTEFLAWSRTTQGVERRTTRAVQRITPGKLDGEPANATVSGDTLIAAVRRTAGREVIALSTAGEPRWRHQDGRTLAVRCAGDTHPPCFAIRVTATHDAADRSDELYTLVPETGELGTQPIYRGALQDIAVDETGERILIAGDTEQVFEIDPRGRVLATHALAMTAIRSVAWDPTGGFFVGGTQVRNMYQVARYHAGELTVIAESEDDILSFVRPSADGSQVLILARMYAPEVWQVQLGE